MRSRTRRSTAQWRELLAEALREGWDSAEIHRRTGAAARTIRVHARKLGFAIVRQLGPGGVRWDVELAKAIEGDETVTMVAHRLKVEASTVSRAVAARGVQLKRATPPPRDAAAWDAELRRAAELGESQSALARRLGVSRQAVSLAVKRGNLTLNSKPTP
jgi:hypothetical protein